MATRRQTAVDRSQSTIWTRAELVQNGASSADNWTAEYVHAILASCPLLKPGPHADAAYLWHARTDIQLLHAGGRYRPDKPSPLSRQTLQAARDFDLLAAFLPPEVRGDRYTPDDSELTTKLICERRGQQFLDELQQRLTSRSTRPIANPITVFGLWDASQDYRRHPYLRMGLDYDANNIIERLSDLLAVFEHRRGWFKGICIQLKHYARVFVEYGT